MDERIRSLYLDYILNRCTPEQLKEVYYLLEKGGYEAEWESALRSVEAPHRQPQPKGYYPEPASGKLSREALFSRVMQTIDEKHRNEGGTGVAMQSRIQPMRAYRLAWVAAASVIAVLVSFYFLSLHKSKASPVRMLATVTGTGMQKTILLADGSRVWLNNTSRISYPETFSGTTRDIYLEGEAFFEVAPDRTKPFLVHAGTLDIQVLGTSFDVRAYASYSTTEVTVATGKISVTAPTGSNGHDHTEVDQTSKDSGHTPKGGGHAPMDSGAAGSSPVWQLTPGEHLAFDRISGAGVLDKTNPALVSAWKDGMLIFQEETLEHTCAELERWYGVRIRIGDESLKNRRITLKQRRESLRNVLEVIRIITGARYTYEDSTVTINKAQ